MNYISNTFSRALFAVSFFAFLGFGMIAEGGAQIRIERVEIGPEMRIELEGNRPVVRRAQRGPLNLAEPKKVFREIDTQPLIAWHNGNVLPGKLTQGTDSKLSWDSDLFHGELQIDFAAIDNVRFPRDEAKQSTNEKYLVHTKSGNKLFGNVTRIENDILVLDSKRHGELPINLNSVSRIVDLENAGYVFVGMSDLEVWTSLKNKKDRWSVTDSGTLFSKQKMIDLQLETEMPDAVQIELVIRWDKHLDFELGLGAPTSKEMIARMPRLETWTDALVLNKEDDFDIVYDSFDLNSKRMELQIQWNRKTNLVIIRNERGEELCRSEVPGDINGINDGIYLANRHGDLQVETLQISKTAAGYDPSKIGVQSTDNQAAYGKLVGFDGKTWIVQPDSGEASEKKSVPADKFRSAILDLSRETKSSSNNVLVRYQDGSNLTGKLVSIADNTLNLETDYSSQPVASNLEGASLVRFLSDPETVDQLKLAGKHRLLTEYGELLGQVYAGTGKAKDVIRWQPVGCQSGLPLTNADTKIMLTEDSKDSKVNVDSDGQQWPDAIYFKNKDTIPCRIVSIDDQGVEFESFAEKGRVAHSLVKAIDFSQAELGGLVSFQNAGWVFTQDAQETRQEQEEDGPNRQDTPTAIEITGPNSLVVRGEERFGHQSLAAIGSLKFTLEWKAGSYSEVEVREFLRSPLDPTGGLGAKIALRDKTVMVSALNRTRRVQSSRATAEDNKAEIEFLFDGQKLIVNVNGNLTGSFPIDPKVIKGSAISLKVNGFAGVTVKDVLTETYASEATPVFIQRDKLEHLMTIPRLQKKDPPTHILCGRNRDFLRGKLTGLDRNKVRFQSQRDDFVFERDLVSSLVWLHANPTDENSGENQEEEKTKDLDPNDSNQVVQVLMNGGKRLTVKAEKWSDDVFDGFSDTLGSCSVPIDEILEIRLGKFASEATDVAYAEWVARPATEPNIVGGDNSDFGTSSELVGTKATDFSLNLLDGSEFKLSKNKGKVVVLNFWATWSGPCVRSLPSMIEAANTFDPDKVVFIAVNQMEATELIKTYIEQKEWKMTVGLDNGKVGNLFDVSSIPQVVIIDQEGKIAFLESQFGNNMQPLVTNAIERIAGAEAVRK